MTYLTVDELQVTRALRVTVSGTVLGTSGVVGVLGHATIGVHGNEVQSSVQSTSKVGNINIKGELVVQELEELVSALILHEIQTGSDVRSSDESDSELIVGCSHTVCCLVIGAVQGAVGSASNIIGAKRRVPLCDPVS